MSQLEQCYIISTAICHCSFMNVNFRNANALYSLWSSSIMDSCRISNKNKIGLLNEFLYLWFFFCSLVVDFSFNLVYRFLSFLFWRLSCFSVSTRSAIGQFYGPCYTVWPIARNSEPVKAGARDSLSIKNFDVLAFDWSVNFQMSFVKQGLECEMATRDCPASGFFFFLILNKVSAAD